MRRLLYRFARIWWRWRRPTTLGSRTLLIDKSRIALVRLTYAAGWHLPGGGVNRGESFLEAAKRETAEECALRAGSWRLFGLYVGRSQGKTDLVSIYVAERPEPIDGRSPDAEIAELRWFPLDAIPGDATPATKRRVQEYLAGGPAGDQW